MAKKLKKSIHELRGRGLPSLTALPRVINALNKVVNALEETNQTMQMVLAELRERPNKLQSSLPVKVVSEDLLATQDLESAKSQIDRMLIKDLPIAERKDNVVSRLEKAGVITVGQLADSLEDNAAAFGWRPLWKMQGIGRSTLRRAQGLLVACGYTLSFPSKRWVFSSIPEWFDQT